MSSMNAVQQYSTNPVDYLHKMPEGPSGGGGEKDLVQQLVQMLGEALSKLPDQQGQEGGAGGMPPPPYSAGGAPPAYSATPPAGSTPPAYSSGAPGAGGAAATPAGGQPMTAQSASGTLASYMSANGKGSLTTDDLYKLSQNTDGNTPPAVSQAANYMLQNPSVYKQIETHDVGGADGKSGVGNFQWAAQGGLGAAGNTPGAGSTPSTPPPPYSSGAPGAGSAPPPYSATPPAGSAPPPYAGATSGAGQMNTQSASGTLASYMNANGKGSLTTDDLYKLSQNTNGNTPPAVSQAANYMLQNPSVYNQIETHDVGGADGKSGVGNFQWAAQGGLNASGVA
ncbi:hypothetical protein [Paraburkholderia solisilvae]|uniref:hypothetical protein n=1 Tax=Paraburkholderia solisilvae TaxID=624376 RepID=UPI0035E50A49